MSEKRGIENTDTFSVKMMKQTDETDFLEDMVLDDSNLPEDVRWSLHYDYILKTFFIELDKKRKEGDRWINFGEEETENIIKLFPVTK